MQIYEYLCKCVGGVEMCVSVWRMFVCLHMCSYVCECACVCVCVLVCLPTFHIPSSKNVMAL